MTRPGGRATRRFGPVGVLVLLLLGGSGLLAAVGGALEPAATDGPVRPANTATGSRQPGVPGLPPTVRGPEMAGVDGDRVVPNGSSRLWFHGDRWWAVLPSPATGAHHVWTFDGPEGAWVDTGTVVDERPFAAIEVFPSGERLFVASTGSRGYASHALRITRFTWSSDGGGWDRDADFPVVLTSGGAPGTRLAVTSDDRLWLARLDVDRLMIGSTDHRGQGFDGFAPVPGQPRRVGGFDVVAQHEEVRVAWRSRDADLLGEAVWADDGWRTHEHQVHGAQGAGPVDAAPVPGPNGALLVTFATSLADRGRNEHDPAIVVVALAEGQARVSVVTTNRDGMRHPRLVVDADRHRVGVFATGPGAIDSGDPEAAVPRTVVDKWAAVEALDFASGPGRPVIVAGGDPAPPLVPVAPLGDRSGSIVVAAITSEGEWATVHEGAPPLGDRTLAVQDTVTLVEDTFESLAPGDPAPTAWKVSEGDDAAASVVAADDRLGRSLELASRTGEQVTACRPMPSSDRPRTEVRARVRTSGHGTASARLLTLRGAQGKRIGVWLSPRGELEWLTSGGRSRTDRFIADGADVTITVTIDRAASLAAVQVVDPSGTVSSSGALGLGPGGADTLDEVCVATSAGDPGGSIRLDELVVESPL